MLYPFHLLLSDNIITKIILTYLDFILTYNLRYLQNIDLAVSPTKIHIRKEYSKTKTARDIYISDEATRHLKQWINWKYNNEERPRKRNDDDLVFTVYGTKSPDTLYVNILTEFEKLYQL